MLCRRSVQSTSTRPASGCHQGLDAVQAAAGNAHTPPSSRPSADRCRQVTCQKKISGKLDVCDCACLLNWDRQRMKKGQKLSAATVRTGLCRSLSGRTLSTFACRIDDSHGYVGSDPRHRFTWEGNTYLLSGQPLLCTCCTCIGFKMMIVWPAIDLLLAPCFALLNLLRLY